MDLVLALGGRRRRPLIAVAAHRLIFVIAPAVVHIYFTAGIEHLEAPQPAQSDVIRRRLVRPSGVVVLAKESGGIADGNDLVYRRFDLSRIK